MFTQVMSALSLHATQAIVKSHQFISSSQQDISSALRSAMQSLSYCTSYASKVITRVCTISVVKIFVTCATSFRSYVPALHMSDPSPTLEQILTSRLPKRVVLLIRLIIASQKLNDIFTLIVHWLQERPRLIKALAIVGVHVPTAVASPSSKLRAMLEPYTNAFYIIGAVLAIELVKRMLKYCVKRAMARRQTQPDTEECNDSPPDAKIHSRRASTDKSMAGNNGAVQLKIAENLQTLANLLTQLNLSNGGGAIMTAYNSACNNYSAPPPPPPLPGMKNDDDHELIKPQSKASAVPQNVQPESFNALLQEIQSFHLKGCQLKKAPAKDLDAPKPLYHPSDPPHVRMLKEVQQKLVQDAIKKGIRQPDEIEQ